MKQKISWLLDLLFINHLLYWFSRLLYGNHIRVINYHGTLLKDMYNFEKQLEFYKEGYLNVGLMDLDDFFRSKKTYRKKPGLILCFDDAHRSNLVNALPLLEKHGFTGWFMIPAGVIDYDFQKQREYVGYYSDEYEKQFVDGRFVFNWEEIKILSCKHITGCHTLTHHRMQDIDGSSTLEKEITFAKKYMEDRVGREISIFCWVGGEERTYTKNAAEMIRKAGYRFSFMTNTAPVTVKTNPLQIQRTNIEANNPIHLVRFQLGLLMDLFYYFKRKRVNKLTQ